MTGAQLGLAWGPCKLQASESRAVWTGLCRTTEWKEASRGFQMGRSACDSFQQPVSSRSPFQDWRFPWGRSVWWVKTSIEITLQRICRAGLRCDCRLAGRERFFEISQEGHKCSAQQVMGGGSAGNRTVRWELSWGKGTDGEVSLLLWRAKLWGQVDLDGCPGCGAGQVALPLWTSMMALQSVDSINNRGACLLLGSLYGIRELGAAPGI